MTFKKVAVIGAGTMGAGIAGQIANAGVEVLLLDMKGDGDNPNALAQRGLDRLNHPMQPGLMNDAAGEKIQIGNIEDDFEKLKDCEWVAEAVVERLDIKKELYKRLNQTCSDDTIVTSNTSTIPIRLLVEEMPESFSRRFAITHFFNPVRYMRLLELVRGKFTDQGILDRLDRFCEQELGKGVVQCADTPGFLGNRVGVFAIQCALHAAFDLELTPSEADSLFGRPMGIPKTGVFGLYDLIGIDLMADVVHSLATILPANDAFHGEATEISLMTRMIVNGQTGNKQGRGFYYGDKETGQRYVLDLKTHEYLDYERLSIAVADTAEKNGVAELLKDNTVYGEFAWRVLSRTLCYAASLLPEVGHSPAPIDDAMKLGYNWIAGPFEIIDQIGVEYFVSRLKSENREVPEYLMEVARDTHNPSCYRINYGELQVRHIGGNWHDLGRPKGVVRFHEKRKTLTPKNTNAMASWFETDNCALVEFHSKANALDAESMSILADAINQVTKRELRGLIVHNDAPHFSCGVNLGAIRSYYERDDFDGMDKFLSDFQQTVLSMANAPFPVVVAPSGLSLGGGFEVVLHSKQVICHANSVMGLVESMVGVVPAGGGCKETLYRWVEKLGCGEDISKACWKAFMNIGYGQTATSPLLARDFAMLRDNDSYQMNRDRLYEVGIYSLENTHTQKDFHRPALNMPGVKLFDQMKQWLKDAVDNGKLATHDFVVGSEIARIVTGGEIDSGTQWSEQDLYDAERQSFFTLTSTDATQKRISHMLGTGKPLRN